VAVRLKFGNVRRKEKWSGDRPGHFHPPSR
jgi:hypothetical protein